MRVFELAAGEIAPHEPAGREIAAIGPHGDSSEVERLEQAIVEIASEDAQAARIALLEDAAFEGSSNEDHTVEISLGEIAFHEGLMLEGGGSIPPVALEFLFHGSSTRVSAKTARRFALLQHAPERTQEGAHFVAVILAKPKHDADAREHAQPENDQLVAVHAAPVEV